jgi:long-chain acyl-CoA synthetase
MGNRFHTDQNQGLQNAYGAWAASQDADRIIAIALSDPIHAMAAFFACANVGRTACMAVENLDNRFVLLSKPLEPIETSPIVGKPIPFIIFTSGSTNQPKAILRNPNSWIYSFNRNGIHPDDTVAVIGNLAHSLPHYAATEAMQIGAKVQFCPKRLTGTPTVVYATPTQLRLVSDVFHTTRMVMIGGGHFTALDHAHCARIFPNADLHIFYGTAETSFISIADKNTPDGSVGQAYDGVEISVLNGEINVSTPMMAHRYLDKVKTFTPSVPYATGEIGEIDAQGNLYLQGRVDRRVTIADKSVHLDAIEADLMTMDGITHAGVIALPDTARGMRAFACVIGANIDHPLLGGVLVLDEWPQLLSGKTDYVRLKHILKQAFA